MAKRHSNKHDDEAMGCFLGLIEILVSALFALFLSKDPQANKVGWGIIGVIVCFWVLTDVGMSGESAMIFMVILAVMFGAFFIASVSKDDSGKSEEEKKKKEDEKKKERISDGEKESTKDKAQDWSLRKSETEHVAVKTHKDYYHSVAEAVAEHALPEEVQKIMIERIQKTDVVECPGLIWKDNTVLYVLPLLKKSRIYSWPLASMPIILYEKRTNPDVDQEYAELGEAEIAAEFEELFPNYSFGQEGVYVGKFILPVGLEVTNASGKILFDLLPAGFHVVDDITQSTWYAQEIKELYQKNILRENGIISFEEYREEREKFLKMYRLREKDENMYEEQMKEAKKMGLDC